MQGTSKRHWVVTLLAIWMFADGLLMLLWEAEQLYSVWGFRHRAGMSRPSAWLIWRHAILDNLWGLLQLLPTPHLLLTLREIVLFQLLHSPRTSSLLRDSLLNLAVFAIAVALGYGLLRAREWARWSYAGLCGLTLVLSILFGWATSIHPSAAMFRFFGGFVSPIVLLVFLVRRGLVAQTPGSQRP
jgi:hypothetical protein